MTPPTTSKTTTSSTSSPPRVRARLLPTDNIAFFDPDLDEWRPLKADTSASDPDKAKAEIERARAATVALKDFLLSSLQMQHIVVLSGSGTSLGSSVKGPSMWSLWDHCVHTNPDSGSTPRVVSDLAKKVLAAVRFSDAVGADDRNKDNIEALLSKCEALLEVTTNSDVTNFVRQSKSTILNKCRDFIDRDDDKQLEAHRSFLHRLSRRRVRDSRLKLFSTNYDLCFEIAAGTQGLVCLDGFSFTYPRFYDPRFFTYDIVRRSPTADDVGTPLEGVFQLYKLHGSVNWERESAHAVIAADLATPENVCMIFPAAGKYQQSYIQPHLELMSQYLSALRQPNTCVVVIGFGFNDDHLSEPIMAAVHTNPHLRLVVVSPTATSDVDKIKHRYWPKLLDMSRRGEDVRLINATFADFAALIPDLKSLSPAERLSKDIKRIAGTS